MNAVYQGCLGKESEVEMPKVIDRPEKCTICKEEYTSTYAEAMPDVVVYICENCIEAAKHNFIWICMRCGRVYMRPKKLVIDRTDNLELKRAYIQCEDMQIIQGIDMCIECDREGIMNYMNDRKIRARC